MTTLQFTVDAKLLRELGERLVGRPHMALAELIKNAYDADARNVTITFAGDSITVSDDGHGMTGDQFRRRWMRIGTTEKSRLAVSPILGRTLTGSKGVGRLAVQLLARSFELRSVAMAQPTKRDLENRRRLSPKQLAQEVEASILWPRALLSRELTDVSVDFDLRPPTSTFAEGSRCGTTVVLRGLTDRWTPAMFRGLAQEIWALQPPFAVGAESEQAFNVVLHSPDDSVTETFRKQMAAILGIATATVTGQLLPAGSAAPKARRFDLPATWNDGSEREAPAEPDSESDPAAPPATGPGPGEAPDSGTEPGPGGGGEAPGGGAADSSEIEVATSPGQVDGSHPAGSTSSRSPTAAPSRGEKRQLLIKVKLAGHKLSRFVVEIPECVIADLNFEVRVFDLTNRQPEGVKVGVARNYLARFGGVHIYDNGFRLPYYGPDQDWLRIDIDHARRLSRSSLVPDDLQSKNALQDLPNNNRLYGFANISTSAEQRAADAAGIREADALAIQITRDRLVPNVAYDQLRRAVRVGVDLYALERARTKVRDVSNRRTKRKDPTPALERASDVVENLKDRVQAAEYQTLRDSLDLVIEDTGARRQEAQAYASLLGALATAGMTSLAYEHEISKQRAEIQRGADELRRLAQRPDSAGVAQQLIEQAARLEAWVRRAERIRSLFRPLLDEESRTEVAQYNAHKLVADVVEQMEVLARGAEVDFTGVPKTVLLPRGGYAAWSAVLQNLLTNAFRANQGYRPRLIRIDAGTEAAPAAGRRSGAGGVGWLRVQDNGHGVDLADSIRLFDPFERGVEPDRHAEALGLGGSGLGLAIVKMMLDEMGASARFEAADPGWSTAVRIDWKEDR